MLRLLLMFTTCLICMQAYSTDYVYNGTSGIKVMWKTADRIGIFPAGSTQSKFDVSNVDGNDGHNATFDGHGISLLPGITYLALYPYNNSYYVDDNLSSALPITYPTLTQTANGSIEHIAEIDYMVAEVTATSQSVHTLTFDHLNALLCLSVMAPKDATFKSMTVHSANASFLQTGMLNLQSRIMTPKTSSRDITLNLSDISVKRGEVLTTYTIIPATNLDGETVTVTFTTTNGDQYYCTFDGQQMLSGNAYNVERTLKVINTVKTTNASSAPKISNKEESNDVLASARALTIVKGTTRDFTISYSDINYEPLPPEYIIGDANVDGNVNVGDVTAVANHILNRTPAKFDSKAADANEDGNINVGDITKIANIILNKNK